MKVTLLFIVIWLMRVPGLLAATFYTGEVDRYDASRASEISIMDARHDGTLGHNSVSLRGTLAAESSLPPTVADLFRMDTGSSGGAYTGDVNSVNPSIWLGGSVATFTNAISGVQWIDIQFTRNTKEAQIYYIDIFQILADSMYSAILNPSDEMFALLLLIIAFGVIQQKEDRTCGEDNQEVAHHNTLDSAKRDSAEGRWKLIRVGLASSAVLLVRLTF